MALANKMMGGGCSAGQAKAINGDVATGLTAAGTTAGTALQLNAAINVMGTVGASSGVKLPACEIADSMEVYNGGASTLTIYPDTGATINNSLSSVSLATNTAMRFRRVTATRWIAMLSA